MTRRTRNHPFAAVAALATAALLAIPALAQGPAKAPPAPKEEAPAETAAADKDGAVVPTVPVKTLSLDNGLTVLLSEDHRLPVVAVEVRYLVGAANERDGRSGFAHLFEHLMFNGSAHFDRDYFTPFEPIGGRVNGTTSRDRTNYYEQVPSQHLELALWMESDRMAHLLPALTQKKLDNQRDVVLNERRQRYDNVPYGLVWEYFTEHLYPKGHPYDHTAIGLPKDLNAATMGDVKAFFRKYYAPSNAVLTIVGDFDETRALTLAKKYFGGIAPGTRAAQPSAALPKTLPGVKTPPENPPGLLPKRQRKAGDDSVHVVRTDAKASLPRVYLAWHTPALYAAGDAELDLLSSVLADGKTSRLYKPLVFEQKVAKDVAAYQVSMKVGSFYVVEATAAKGKSIEEVTRALEKALAEALKMPPTEDEITRALASYKKSFYGRVEGVLSRAQLLSTYFHLTGKADYLAQDLARYTQATPATVKAAADQFISTDRALYVYIVPPAKPEADAAAKKGATK